MTVRSESLTKVTRPSRAGDRVFSTLVTGAGVLILAILGGVAAFLLIRGWPALTAAADKLPGNQTFWHYVWPLTFGTILSSTIAIILAVPLAVGVALFITYFAPKRIANTLAALIDLLAAIPSVIYGLWGIAVLGPAAVGLQAWLYDHLDFLPFFKGPPSPTGRTMFVLGIVLAVMILPIISAIVREVFAQTPRSLREGSLALGATRWEMIRMTVLPFGRPAIISASMLGLGRALGETMAVALILSVSGGVTFNLISSGNPSTIAANIALNFPESSGLAINLLIATGLVLFGITLLVNSAARLIISRQIRE
ncbi:MAG TPA: phosphate ABC transporter permease subunit PstC [Gaiellaceae bacterium]